MQVFRLHRKKYKVELSGKGASKISARWNSKGTEIVYTSQNRALAMAEVVVHLSVATMPKDFVMLEIDIPDNIKIKTIKKIDLPLKWNIFPFITNTQKIGDDFINENKYCCLKVPSVVVKGEYNLLINPFHKDFKKIKIVNYNDFVFDARFF
jgi:RES domain-containing protein